jgi:hypothetical protein
MTRTISLITVTVGAALMLAAPAVADDWGSDRRSEAVVYLNPDGADRAAALEQQRFALMLDAREKSQTAKRDAQLASASADPRPSVPTAVAVTSSGRLTDTLQVGLGFGIGVLLTVALFLAVRFTRVHRLAH